jgi:peptidoglycan/LPS O-acetylase OafA/YrhL
LLAAGVDAHISTERFAFVHALRGIAALSVMLHHAYAAGLITDKHICPRG